MEFIALPKEGERVLEMLEVYKNAFRGSPWFEELSDTELRRRWNSFLQKNEWF